MGPYATVSNLAAMGVAQRYGKVMIESSIGIPKLQTCDMTFPASSFGPAPDETYPNVILRSMSPTAPTCWSRAASSARACRPTS
jgi:branched-chain amino acid transport system substrate-binding protein